MTEIKANAKARRHMARAIRSFVRGEMTGDEVATAVSSDAKRDPCISAMCQLVDVLCYEGGTAIDKMVQANRHVLSRSILFLHNDVEYEWPPMTMWHGSTLFINALTLGLWNLIRRRRVKLWVGSRDVSVWPFSRREEMQECMRHPLFLTGGRVCDVAVRRRV